MDWNLLIRQKAFRSFVWISLLDQITIGISSLGECKGGHMDQWLLTLGWDGFLQGPFLSLTGLTCHSISWHINCKSAHNVLSNTPWMRHWSYFGSWNPLEFLLQIDLFMMSFATLPSFQKGGMKSDFLGRCQDVTFPITMSWVWEGWKDCFAILDIIQTSFMNTISSSNTITTGNRGGCWKSGWNWHLCLPLWFSKTRQPWSFALSMRHQLRQVDLL